METHMTIREIISNELRDGRDANYMMWHQRVTRNPDLLPSKRVHGTLWVSRSHYMDYRTTFLVKQSVFDVLDEHPVPIVDFPEHGKSVSLVDAVPLLRTANIRTTIDTIKNGIYVSRKLKSFKVRARVYVRLADLDEWAQQLETRITKQKRQRVLNE